MSQPLPERVVCAANKVGDTIILGLRHNDEFMQAAVARLVCGLPADLRDEASRPYFKTTVQGFLTNRKRWVSREEAFQIASNQEQIVRKTGYDGNQTLYSEDVY